MSTPRAHSTNADKDFEFNAREYLYKEYSRYRTDLFALSVLRVTILVVILIVLILSLPTAGDLFIPFVIALVLYTALDVRVAQQKVRRVSNLLQEKYYD